MSEILDVKITKKLANKSDIPNLVNNADLNIKLATLTAKAVKAEQDKISKLKAFNSSYFHGKKFFS